MELQSTDPYEQKLYQLFKSYETKESSGIDRDGLIKLCTTLELERGDQLVNKLICDGRKRVNFPEFRAALLQILGEEIGTRDQSMDTIPSKHVTQITISNDNPATITVNAVDNTDNDDDGHASDREVKPKFVVGTKKYGRRSRPASDVLNSDEDESDLNGSKTETYYVSSGTSEEESKRNKVQRSASQSDIHGTKRKRPLSASRLKRCASLPPQRNALRKPVAAREKASQEENLSNLSEIWNAFGSDSLTLSQLEVVCQNLGLRGLDAKKAAKEAFEKLSLPNDAQIVYADFLKLIKSDSNVLSRENSLNKLNASTAEECVILIKETGAVSSDIIVDMWEGAGVVSASALLVGLGFYSNEIQIAELITSLEEEIQRCQDEKEATPLLKASLTLHKAEVGALRQAFKQLIDENKKLNTNNKEANNRAAILAQEVDERHTNIEKTSQKEIKALEQRHAEAIRELTLQITQEREQYTAINARLEMRIKNLESDENKLKAEVSSLLEENSTLDGEKCDLQAQIADLYEQNIKLNQEVAELEENGASELKEERSNEEILELIEKVSNLQVENANLRDKNDELSAEIEGMSLEITKLKRDEPAINNKRRGDSPSKVRNCEESPRLGKQRKFDDGMALDSELQTSSGFSSEPSTDETKSLDIDVGEVTKYKLRCQDLEASLEQMRKEYEDCEDYWQNKLADERQLYEEEQRQNDDKLSDLLRKMSDYEEQFAEKEGKLSPIDENSMLEQQYNELEIEMEELKEKARDAIADKQKEVDAMKTKLRQYEYAPPTPPRVDTPDSPASSTISYLFWNQSSIHGPARDYQNPNFNQVNTYKDETPENARKSVSPIQKPSRKDDAKSVASTHTIHKSEGASSRTSPIDEAELSINEAELREEIELLVHQRDCLIVELQQLQEAKPILAKAYARTPHPSLTNRLQFLENKNKHLNNALRQQQSYMETIIHQTWQQQRMELADVRNRLEAQSVVIAEQAQRLANADLLAKDLFVENSHLTATIQRLEQQRTRQALMQLTQHLPHLQQQGLSGMP